MSDDSDLASTTNSEVGVGRPDDPADRPDDAVEAGPDDQALAGAALDADAQGLCVPATPSRLQRFGRRAQELAAHKSTRTAARGAAGLVLAAAVVGVRHWLADPQAEASPRVGSKPELTGPSRGPSGSPAQELSYEELLCGAQRLTRDELERSVMGNDLQGALAAADEAAAHLRRALRVHQEGSATVDAGEAPREAAAELVSTLLRLAGYREVTGDPATALVLRREARELAGRYLGGKEQADVKRHLAQGAAAVGRFNEALVLLAEVRDHFVEQGDELGSCAASVALAELLTLLGDDSRSLRVLNEAAVRLDSHEAAGAMTHGKLHAELRQVLNLEAVLREFESASQAAGDDLEALYAAFGNERMLEMLSLATSLQDPDSLSEDALVVLSARFQIDVQRVSLSRRAGRLDDAERLLEHLRVTVTEQTGDTSTARLMAAHANWQAALLAVERDRADQALDLLDHLEPQLTGLLVGKRAGARHAKARALLLRDQHQAAVAAALEGLSALRDHPDPDLEWRLHDLLGQGLARLGREDEARAAFRAAVDVILDLRRSQLGHRLDSTFLIDKLPVFERALDAACRADDAVDAARLIDFVKARALTAVLSIARDPVSEPHTREEEFEAVSAALDALDYQRYAGVWGREQNDRRKTLRCRRAQLLEELRFSDPRWRTLTEPARVDVDLVLTYLQTRHHAALTLYLREEEVVAVLLVDGEAVLGRTSLAPSTVRALRAHTDNLRRDSPQWLDFDLHATHGVCAEDLVPRHLWERALAADALLMVPNGLLHLVPWAGLVLDGQRLCERVAIGVLPSLACLLLLGRVEAPPSRVALIGAPDYSGLELLDHLPGAAGELGAVAQVHAGSLLAAPRIGPAATQGGFWALADDAEAAGGDATLHVSCHGTLDDREPMSSGLLLADGRIDAGDILLRHLPYTEVVLSSCSSGWRPTVVRDIDPTGRDDVVLMGDDALGLPAAFLEAGASSALVSIPQAQDGVTKAFVEVYHVLRRSGCTPIAALHGAQKTMLQLEITPALWIGFTVYGLS